MVVFYRKHVQYSSSTIYFNVLVDISIRDKLSFDFRHVNTNLYIIETLREKTNNLGCRPSLTQTGLYSHSDRSRLEAWNFGYKKKRDCTIHGAKTKMLISCAVTCIAQLLCAFVFAYAICWFSYVVVHIASLV